MQDGFRDKRSPRGGAASEGNNSAPLVPIMGMLRNGQDFGTINRMYFFESSQAAHDALTELFDFAEPARGALWNFRWQLLGYLNVRPKAKEEELHHRFLHAADVNYSNLKGWPTKPWSTIEQQFSRIMLTNSFAIYESWISATLTDLGLASKANELGLQQPASNPKGHTWLLAKLPVSSVMRDSFAPALRKSRRFATAKQLDNLFLCYRAFKEFRNAIAHAGAVATQRTVDAHRAFAVLTTADVGMTRVPTSVAPVLNTPIEPILRGVIGFSDVLFRLITTLDSELAQTEAGEAFFLKRWRSKYPGLTVFNPQKAGRHAQLSTKVHAMDLPRPQAHAKLCDLLRHHGLIKF